ncbi:glycoside hydrolase family 28 protein [Chania multitudinisentens]|uniref:glycoside hydrolase family 28 protein n=1 Tax=Chania multitudinisentens TaxID=1639108 RepID=UPI00138ADD82|nr:glycoside hydrolase family 28 protein [Chania multitudinisentens]
MDQSSSIEMAIFIASHFLIKLWAIIHKKEVNIMEFKGRLTLLSVFTSALFTSSVMADTTFKPVTIESLNIPERTCNIRDYGAEATGIWYDTKAFQSAIDDCAGKGGGTVLVPAGFYLSEPLYLKNNINLHLEKGAILQAAAEKAAYTPSEATKKWAGVPKLWPNAENWLAFLNIAEGNNIAITGEGTIDGQGSALLEDFRANARKTGSKGPTNRPRMVFIKDSNHILIENITLQNSPSFHVVFFNTENITINKTKIFAPEWWENTDAIDPMHSRYVTITENTISCGDDHIAIKSVFNDDNTHDYYIARNKFLEGRGLSIGSEASGGIRNILAEDNTFENAMYGIRIKSPRGKGGLVSNVVYKNTRMANVETPVVLAGYYKGGPVTAEGRTEALQKGEFAGGFMLGNQIYPAQTDKAQPFNKHTTPHFDNIQFINLESDGNSKSAGFIIGTPEKPFTNILFDNVRINAREGLRVRNANLRLKNTTITSQDGKAIIEEAGAVISTDQ